MFEFGRSALGLALAAGLVAVGARGSQDSSAASAGTVAVGSKNFAESRVLAELMAQVIEGQTDLEVERKLDLGGTMVAFTALRTGAIDLYAEYSGTAWAVLLEQDAPSGDPLQTFLAVQGGLRERFGLEYLSPFGFDNTYALALRGDIARERGIERISQLAPIAAELRGGFSVEFGSRADGLPGLLERYGFALGDARAMEHSLAYEALAAGELDLIDAYATDGKLLDYDLVVLADDLGFFPPYHAAPLLRAGLLAEHPELAAALGRVAFQLDEATVMGLNHAVEVQGRDFAQVARDFLRTLDLAPAGATAAARPSLAQFVRARLPITVSLALEHLAMTAVAVLLAALVAIPGGLLLAPREHAARLALGAAGVLQTVPSIALLAVMIAVPGLGLSVRSAIAALFLYALLPILRNTVSGLRAVDADLVDAARGLGLTPRQVLVRIQLPIAMPAIMAGLRTATVISVGVATLAAFIGAGGLGEPIVTGLYLNDVRLILAGALPAAALALAVDGLLGLVERRVTPAGLRREADQRVR
ncbi:glycine betaine ABC transporter substrate-binding protein [Engelhardtia mirabilis]|uniref:Glycine betaine/carnitine/choline-binding protein OpuCC n=1 Tax=Engelhardtia mirabilis TaxID=2528011 RepID=A0A518BR20_9BACT|nr:Glycine betaine/carnitine/choline-binding protein OpuCC precursor [Planctomycetes bacterium Pla133]QDV03745.1 Glycine betaine/carnitine/choline-binding protein OpuCC precursor [Planctomycetes bacterium Pla86]